MKENVFTLEKARSRRCPAHIITDADYADDIALLTNTLTQAESLRHNLDQAAGDIGFRVNADKRIKRNRKKIQGLCLLSLSPRDMSFLIIQLTRLTQFSYFVSYSRRLLTKCSSKYNFVLRFRSPSL